MNHLVPEVRVNKNGAPVTKHVRPDEPRAAGAGTTPVPAVPPVPPRPAGAPATAEELQELFDRTREANAAWASRPTASRLGPADREVLARLIREMADRDDNAETRVTKAASLVETGDALGARSVLSQIRFPAVVESRFQALDVWDGATDCGVLERNRLYAPGEEGAELYAFIVTFFGEAPEVFPLWDADDDDFRQLALIHAQFPEASGDEVAGFFWDRGRPDAQLYSEAMGSTPALGDGAL